METGAQNSTHETEGVNEQQAVYYRDNYVVKSVQMPLNFPLLFNEALKDSVKLEAH